MQQKAELGETSVQHTLSVLSGTWESVQTQQSFHQAEWTCASQQQRKITSRTSQHQQQQQLEFISANRRATKCSIVGDMEPEDFVAESVAALK